MAAFRHFNNMYDAALKPRLLRTLLREHVPDESRPFSDPTELSILISMIKTHSLLSEALDESMDKKLVETWKAALDEWADRLSVLVSSDKPDKCWAGVCLLGITCQECSSHRFLASYSSWLQKLHAQIQAPAASHIVRVACLASLSDLFVRLGQFPNTKKDGNSLAGKLIHPFLKLLNEDDSEAVWDGGSYLLCSIMSYFPSAIQRHYDSVEAAIALKIISGKCSPCLLRRLAHCMAVLPKSKGDVGTWCLLIQKILLLINSHLNDAFQSIEEENKGRKILNLLVPPGTIPPLPLGCCISSDKVSVKATNKSERLLSSSLSALIHCCCEMLTKPYPVQVNVPIRALLALAERMLLLDGSVPQSLLPIVTATQQESICSELPILHSCGLDLLIALTKGMRSQILPHAACIVQLIGTYFNYCKLPELRIKVYSCIRILLMSMGIGIIKFLAQIVIDNVFMDLNPDCQSGLGILITPLKTTGVARPNHKKRKHSSTAAPPEDKNPNSSVEAPNNHPVVPAVVKIAALEALEVLLTVGGALRFDSWRTNIDTILISVVTDSVHERWPTERNGTSLPNGQMSVMKKLQLSALRALLASLLSQTRVRPPNIAKSLELFQRGRLETGTEIAEFCAHALLALEVLIHPRALPLEDYSDTTANSFGGRSHKFPENIHSGIPPVTFSHRTEIALPDPEDDELYRSWRQNRDETEAPVPDQVKNVDYGEEYPVSDCSKTPTAEKLSKDNSLVRNITEKSKTLPPESDANDPEMECADEIIVESQKHEASNKMPMPSEQDPIPCTATASEGAERESMMVPTSGGIVDHEDTEIGLDGNVGVAQGNAFSTAGSSLVLHAEVSGKSKELVHSDNESSLDVFPDIIDVEPDSDEE